MFWMTMQYRHLTRKTHCKGSSDIPNRIYSEPHEIWLIFTTEDHTLSLTEMEKSLFSFLLEKILFFYSDKKSSLGIILSLNAARLTPAVSCDLLVIY